jgi:hypothetical protein
LGKKFKKVALAVVEIVAIYYTGGASIFRKFLIAGALSQIASVAASAFTKARRTAPTPLNVTVRGTVEYRRIVFGRKRVGGVLVFYGAKATDARHLWFE